MRIEITPAAQADVDAIIRYSRAEHGQIAADEYIALFYARLDRLSSFPEIGATTGRKRGTRRLSFGRHTMYYEIHGDLVLIVRVLHQAMDVGKRLKR
ncbi:MAG: type II toxin-antitoxin system RelE/ParE family toxin [Proteobacteria bacterium]|nr:type II toxin-antitoxin system RelE/ParE family toxin [Pseudomonadota bacterium]